MKGILFDLYHFENLIYLWIRDDNGVFHLVHDLFNPVIHLCGPDEIKLRFVERLRDLDAIREEPQIEERKLFYENRTVETLRITIEKPSILNLIKRRLYHFYGKLDVYHSDIEIPIAYMNEKKIHPTCELEVTLHPDSRMVMSITPLDSIQKIQTQDFRFRILRMGFLRSHREGFSRENTLRLSTKEWKLDLKGNNFPWILGEVNRALLAYDPDIILSSFGDGSIFPSLFEASQRLGIPLYLDRDIRPITKRAIIKRGHSYNTYGSWIYMAPSYPLFGRWHIDVTNSFVYKESELEGVIELAIQSRLPVQRLARSSTGAALTAIETRVALEMGYLVPWQKSAVEAPKSAYELLLIDKGGLVFVPDTREGSVQERVVQIDFSQMYPTIMDRRTT